MQIPKVRSIKLNLADPQERNIDDYIIHNVGNFSGYIKRLIWNEMQGVIIFKENQQTNIIEEKNESEGDILLMEDLV